MAPRSRKRVGLKRIDAALDALRPMGFPDDVVRRTVRTLLKVYDGDAGWTFIEEASYKMVIDTIIEDQEKCEQENTEPKSSVLGCLLKGDTLKDEPGVEAHSPLDHSMQVEFPHVLSLPQVDIIPCSLKDKQEKLVVKVHSPHIHSADIHSPQIHSAVVHSPQIHSPQVHTQEIHGRQIHSPQVLNLDVVSPSLVDIPCSLKDDMPQDKSGGQIKVRPSHKIYSTEVPSPRIDSPQMVDHLPIRKRKPCYGWISSDDEEDLVYLTPAK